MPDGSRNDHEVWDVVVVGAGPAGATAAIAARVADPRARVLLLDRADFPRDKSCGDGIAPHAVDVLRRLGVGDVVDGWTPLERLGLSRRGRTVEGRLDRSVWVIPREVFDARLVAHAVAAGASLRRHRVRTVEIDDEAVLIDGASNESIRGRVVIGADGAHSLVRRTLGVSRTGAQALALRGYAPTDPARRGRQVIRYGEHAQPSYAWAFDRGDGLSNVGYGELVTDGRGPPRQVLLDRLEELLPGTAAGGRQWRGHHLPLSGFGWRGTQPPGPVLLVGDAAGLVNPMTGEGIYYAVATGELAGRAAVADLPGDPSRAGMRYGDGVGRLLDLHLRHTWLAARLSRHPAVVEAGIAAAARDQRAFDQLVALGLGDGRITPRLATGLARELVTGALRG